MKTNFKTLIVLLTLFSTVAIAKNDSGKSQKKESFGQQTAKIWETQVGFSLKLIDQMPEDKLEYRPNESVRSFAELFKHLAGSSLFFQAIVNGEDINSVFPKLGALEKTPKSKDEVKAVFKTNMTQMIDVIRSMSKKDLNKTFTFSFLPGTPTKTYKEIITAMGHHLTHHRGQATTYLRLNNIQPSPYQNWW